jgi:hypothetical protein
MNKLQKVPNAALRIDTDRTADTNVHHLHQEIKLLSLTQHLKLYASQLRQKAQNSTHPLHSLTIQPHPHRLMKQTNFHNSGFTTDIEAPPQATQDTIKQNLKTIHTTITEKYLVSRNPAITMKF